MASRSSLARRAGAFVFRAVAASIVPDSTDTQCGFKFFSGPLARTAAGSLRTGGFAFDVELLMACLRLGATVTEIPVQWQDVTGSTFSVSRHSAAVFRDLGSIWLRSLVQDVAPVTRGGPGRVRGLGHAGRATGAARLRWRGFVRRRPRAGRPRDWPADAAGLDGLRVIIANWRDPWHPQAGGAERYAWEIARALTDRGAAVRYLTARAPGQGRGECIDGIEIIRRGGRFTLYPRALAWLLAHRRWARCRA